METISLAGVVSEDCEMRQDKKGHDYIRFKVGCESTDIHGEVQVYQYRCFCYNVHFSKLKKGDIVFLSGSFNINVNKDNKKINFDIYVHQMIIVGNECKTLK